jgi:hypothetical protein
MRLDSSVFTSLLGFAIAKFWSVLWIRKYYFRIRIRIQPGHFLNWWKIICCQTGSKSLKLKNIELFFINFFKSVTNTVVRIRIYDSEFMDPDPGGQLITDPPDPDPQHWLWYMIIHPDSSRRFS